MKFMKLGTRPDTFYTEETTRTVLSEVPGDLAIQINNITYLLHKFPLVSKCGLLQRLCSDSSTSATDTVDLHDIPGGKDAFELCAKFCYGITINLSAYNFVPAFCASKFLRMSESLDKGNFVVKLEAFFSSCILEGWKDSILALQTTVHIPEWSENLGIIRRCIDSIVDKILTPPPKVTWSYTYTRPGYTKKHQQYVPKDWWTEDISDLDMDLFRCIITAIKSTNMLPPQLIGEALHVYASRWLPDAAKIRQEEASASQTEEQTERNRRIHEAIASMIPADSGSVSVGFLLRLLSIGNHVGASPATKAELLRRSSMQLEEAMVGDLVFPSHDSNSDEHYLYDVESVRAVVGGFLVLWRRQFVVPAEDGPFLRSVRRVGKLIDCYLQVIAKDVNMPVLKIVSLAEALPELARPKHDDLYKAINIYLKEHPDLSKVEKKRLCRILDCQKLSPAVCAHAVKNERLPLRTVVQVLFFDQERASSKTSTTHNYKQPPQQTETDAITKDVEGKLKLGPDEDDHHGGKRTSSTPKTRERDHHKMKISNGKLEMELERKVVRSSEIEGVAETKNGKEIRSEGSVSGSKLEPKKITIQGKNKSVLHSHDKGRDR